jgi:GT2 family glycosyltransferase
MVPADWVAGFFMLFRSGVFERLGGFDERYFLYYEDVELCSRARLAGSKIVWMPGVKVVHDARRHSHRDAKFLYWHLRSIARFFASPVYRAARRLEAAPADQSRL